jgi:hypothetical protein
MTGVDDLVISLVAKGLTTGEVSAHLPEIYGADVTQDTVSRITDRLLEGRAEWQNRRLDRVYPVLLAHAEPGRGPRLGELVFEAQPQELLVPLGQPAEGFDDGLQVLDTVKTVVLVGRFEPGDSVRSDSG